MNLKVLDLALLLLLEEWGSDFTAVTTLGFDATDDHHIITSLGGDLTDINALRGGLSGTALPLAVFAGTYTVTSHSFGLGTVFLPVVNTATGATGDVTISGGIIASTDGGQQWKRLGLQR